MAVMILSQTCEGMRISRKDDLLGGSLSSGLSEQCCCLFVSVTWRKIWKIGGGGINF